MGRRNSQTRKDLEKLSDDDFRDFLDDVADLGLKGACELNGRDWTQSATVNWIKANTERSRLYGIALEVRAELAIHEGREIVDGATPETAGVAKLRGNWRQWEAAKWNRQTYGDKVDVAHTGNVTVEIVRFADIPVLTIPKAGGDFEKGLPAPKDVTDAVLVAPQREPQTV